MSTTCPTPFMPVVHEMDLMIDDAMLAGAQAIADRALALDFDAEIDTYPTTVHGLYACPMPVGRHQDLEGARPGMIVRGLVLRSDGHRLHSDRLDAAGVTEGLPLRKGSFYELDPYDPHWTTVPDGPEDPQLVFHVEGDMPDGRTSREIVEETLVYLRDEVPYRNERAKERECA